MGALTVDNSRHSAVDLVSIYVEETPVLDEQRKTEGPLFAGPQGRSRLGVEGRHEAGQLHAGLFHHDLLATRHAAGCVRQVRRGGQRLHQQERAPQRTTQGVEQPEDASISCLHLAHTQELGHTASVGVVSSAVLQARRPPPFQLSSRNSSSGPSRRGGYNRASGVHTPSLLCTYNTHCCLSAHVSIVCVSVVVVAAAVAEADAGEATGASSDNERKRASRQHRSLFLCLLQVYSICVPLSVSLISICACPFCVVC
mmetsp:Transcript_34018/g.97971  ORF Transcript_34018/g.97971 Transcript_34018/m.97971 type:complete len:256 (-) Transcript_34018:193-960(-)